MSNPTNRQIARSLDAATAEVLSVMADEGTELRYDARLGVWYWPSWETAEEHLSATTRAERTETHEAVLVLLTRGLAEAVSRDANSEDDADDVPLTREQALTWSWDSNTRDMVVVTTARGDAVGELLADE